MSLNTGCSSPTLELPGLMVVSWIVPDLSADVPSSKQYRCFIPIDLSGFDASALRRALRTRSFIALLTGCTEYCWRPDRAVWRQGLRLAPVGQVLLIHLVKRLLEFSRARNREV